VFLARDQHGLAFLHWVRDFLAIFIKVHLFVQNRVFRPRSARFGISELGAPLLLAIFIKVHEFLQNSVFSRKSARFVDSALGASLYSDYQQSARVCTKQTFKPDFGTFSHCRTGHTTFERFSDKVHGFGADQHVLSF